MSEQHKETRTRRSSRYSQNDTAFSPVQPPSNKSSTYRNVPYVNGVPCYDNQADYYQQSEPDQPRHVPAKAADMESASKKPSSVRTAAKSPASEYYHRSDTKASSQKPQQHPSSDMANYNKSQPSGTNGGGSTFRQLFLKILIAAIAVALVVAIIFGIQKQMEKSADARRMADYVNSYNNVYCQNVYVDGIHLGGKTKQEALDAVTTQVQQKKDSWYLRLTFEGKEIVTLTAPMLGLDVDITGVMQEAWNQGHTGAIAQRNAAMENLLADPYYAYTSLPSGNLDVLEPTLVDIASHLSSSPQDAYLAAFDPSLSDPFIFQEEIPGKSINTDTVRADLTRMIGNMESGDYDIVPELIPANVTVSMLRSSVSLRATATTPISTASTTDRTNNIRRAFEMISGTIVAPGSTFNFNNVVGRRTTENGFFPAIEYAYGTERMGVGGGVCQASTTVYMAALKAGMQIDKRTPHSQAVNYTDYGMDATVSWEGSRRIDLNFTNTTGSNIYIVAKVESDPANKKRLRTNVTIYGESMDGTTYDIVTQLVAELDPPVDPKYVKDSDHQYVTYTDEEYQYSKARKGYIYDSYRVTYKNGAEVSRDFLYRDEYPSKAAVIYVGTELR